MEQEQQSTELDDMDAGFSGAAAEPTETPASEAQEEQGEPQDAPKYIQITEDEWKARAAEIEALKATQQQQTDKVFGKIGGLERVLQQLQSSTPQGQAIEVTQEDVAELAEEYPELASAYLKTLQKVAGKLRGTGAVDPAQFEQIAARIATEKTLAVQEERKAQELEALDEVRPGWREEIFMRNADGKFEQDADGNFIDAPDFAAWKATLKPATLRKLLTSLDADYTARGLEAFDKWRAEKAKPATPQRPNRMASAVPPKSVAGHVSAPSEDDELEAGFRGT